MSYCRNCGSEVNEGNVFCTNCGMAQVSESGAENKRTGNPNGLRQANFSGLGDIAIKMLTRPVSGAKQFAETSEKNSVIAVTLLMLVIQGLLGVWKVNQVASMLEGTVTKIFNQFVGIVNLISPGEMSPNEVSTGIAEITGAINKVKSLLNIPYGKIFIQNVVMFSVAVAVMFAVISLLIAVMNQKKSSSFTVFKASLIAFTPIIYFEFFSIMVSYLSFYLGIFVFYIGIVISIACLSMVLKEQFYIEDSFVTFIVALAFVLSYVSLLICFQKFIITDITDIVSSFRDIAKIL